MSAAYQFGRLERLLHRLAFRTGVPQRTLEDLEEGLFRRELDAVALDEPVFISGLPRSGTTMLLRLLAATGRFATHEYRDMPFVLSPLIWHRLAGRWITDDEARERAHGDGILVSASSPEAFEEVAWKRWWPEHYGQSRIRPWDTAEGKHGFGTFFRRLMSRVLAAREAGKASSGGGDAGSPLRFLSKNNVNVARLAMPLFAGLEATFIVPFREPVQHAASMLAQHRRFTTMQAEDPFALEYMEAIGHHDFGKGLRPIDFGGWLEAAGDPDRLEFWLRYWNAAYRDVITNAGASVHLVSYADLVENPESVLARIAVAAGVPAADLVRLGERLRPPREHDVGGQGGSAEFEEAQYVYRELERRRIR